MSSNITLQDDIGNLQTEKQKASESYSEKPFSKDKYIDMLQNKVPSLDKYGSASKTETEHTEKLDTKTTYLTLASLDDKNMKEQKPKNMTIKTIKSAHDDRSYSSMSASQDGCSITSKKKKRNYQKIQSQGIK